MPPVSRRVPSKFHDSELMCDDAWRLPVCTHLYSRPCAGGCELWISGVGSKMQTLSSYAAAIFPVSVLQSSAEIRM